jgi:hypothetical protein
VAAESGDFTKINVLSRPRLRKKGHETDPKLHTKKRQIKFIKNRVQLEYRVDQFKITVLAVP